MHLNPLAFRLAAFAGALLGFGVAGAMAAPAAGDFDHAIGPFLNQHCIRCHGPEKQKGEFRVDTLSRDFIVGSSVNQWAEVMGKISSGEMPPKKEPKPDATEAAQVVDWLAAKMKEGETARLAKRERVSFHKLTREEYVYTVEDLLGVHFDATDPNGLSEDADWNGFERIGSVLSLSPSHVEKYFAAAEAILTEAFPAPPPPAAKGKQTPKVNVDKHHDAIDLRGGPNRADLEAQGLADKVRVDLWPGADLQGGRIGPAGALPLSGYYKIRIKLSGLKPAKGPAPHLSFYCVDLDRMLFERDIIAPEDKPTTVEFIAHLPAGNLNYRLTNDVPGPSNLPRSGRADPRIPFFSIKDGRRPWQMKLTDEEGKPLYPFLIIDSVDWEGPIQRDGPTFAQKQYLPAKPGDFTEARTSLSRFAEKAFRRPAKAEEVERLISLMDSETKSGEKFDAAYRTAMLAVLCSKDFLYLVEGVPQEPRASLSDYELASRLSYFLWSTMPDDSLLAAAKDGSLHQSKVLSAQVKRMLADARSKRFSESFTRQWLQLRRVGMFPPDKKLYPNYDAWLEKSMIGETTAFFGQVLKNNMSLREFLDSNWTMVNARLADHYQISCPSGDGFTKVELKPEDHRGGILTQAAILSLTSDGTRHRPVHRGKWILESIFGRSPPPPPANVKPIEPTPVNQPKATLRMKLAAHTTDATCFSCHRNIDPLGLAFDNFDAIGRWRTEEVVNDGSPGANPKVDASGELPDGRKFANADEFKKLLAADLDTFNATFVEKLATYAMRRTMTIDDRARLAEVAKKSKDADYKLQDIIEALVTSELFQRR
jgi:mono/diheme cytochrome c family protein